MARYYVDKNAVDLTKLFKERRYREGILRFLEIRRKYELYRIYCEHKPKLREYLWFIRQLRKRRDISI